MSITSLTTEPLTSSFKLDARLKYNATNAMVKAGERYILELLCIDEPFDDLGYKVKNFDGFKFFLKWLFQPRFPQAQYFCLCGSIGNDASCFFAIGQKLEFVAPMDGELFLFINDYNKDFTYSNNKGKAAFSLKKLV